MREKPSTHIKHFVSDTVIFCLLGVFFVIGLLPKARRFLLSKIEPF